MKLSAGVKYSLDSKGSRELWRADVTPARAERRGEPARRSQRPITVNARGNECKLNGVRKHASDDDLGYNFIV